MKAKENILIKPVITEKATAMAENKGVYTFIVAGKVNKIEIKNAVEKHYNVTVESVNTMNLLGEKKVRYTKNGFSVGRKPSYKKAYVTLKKGETIDLFSNI